VAEPLRYADEYDPEFVGQLRSSLLHAATVLGDVLDHIVVVGGLVPSLLPGPEHDAAFEAHVGTTDLDLGLSLAVLDDNRYEAIASSLVRAGFEPDVNENGQRTRQRWRSTLHPRLTIDFLIPPASETTEPGTLQSLTSDLAAYVIPGLDLAHRDRVRVRLAGTTLRGARTERDVWVCGLAAFIVLKALAFAKRSKDKDAYDLVYVLQTRPEDVARAVDTLRALLQNPDVDRALAILRSEFDAVDGHGPIAVATFLTRGPDAVIQADAVAYVRDLLRLVHAPH
jgi:hypothetical protein